MKNMKKYIQYLAVSLVVGSTITACTKSFLTVTPVGTNLEANYYQNQAQAFAGLVSVYDVVGWQGGGFVTKENAMDAASDDHVAGGGSATDISDLQMISNYTLTPAAGPQAELWKAGYSGVFRANVLLGKLPNVPMDAALKARYIAETKGLRAYFYFDLVRLFKNIPLITSPLPADQIYDIEQVAPAVIYTQIEKDLTEAIAEPSLPNTVAIATDGGRWTKGTMHALLGKVYLYEQKWTQAAAEFNQVNGTPGVANPTYGYKLLPNFGDLFKLANKYNSESILEVAHSSQSNGNWGCIACTEGNVLNIITGPRSYTPTASAPDYISGYGFLPITADLFNAIHFDPRNKPTVANLDSLKAKGLCTYDPSYQNTGFFLEKYMGRVSTRSTGSGNFELNFPQNLYEIRLADTYLMEAEALIRGSGDLVRAAALMTAVHSRAYNDNVSHPLPATLAALKLERRLELAGEGHRWFDLVRWGDAPTALASKGFIAGKHEILPVPLNDLTSTKLKQSKEWGGTL